MSGAPPHQAIIIGGGIAGASAAYFLTRLGLDDVLLLEREDQPGYHTTGRSAALLVEYSTERTVRRLLLDGASFLRRPPDGFPDELLDPAGVLLLARGVAWREMRDLSPVMTGEGIANRLLTPAQTRELVPVLSTKNGLVDGGMLLTEDGHLDVHGLLWGYLGQAARHGCRLQCDAEVMDVITRRGRCEGVETGAGTFRAPLVVNAAGAWAGQVGAMAGALPVAFSPLRRTIITFDAPQGVDCRRWPMVDHEGYEVYFKPESSELLASPMDQTPSPPCDARPAEEDMATAVDRLQSLAPDIAPRTIRRKWAGLRTFSPDRLPVVGPDPRVEGFFWLAGQGGWGIETSPALGRLAAELIVKGRSDLRYAEALSPGRFLNKKQKTKNKEC